MASTASIDLAQSRGDRTSAYFADRGGRTWELAWLPAHSPRWVTRHIAATATGRVASSASRALAACELNGGMAGIYFLDATGHVWELMGRPDDDWLLTDVTAQAEGNPPPAGAATTLSCFSVDGKAPHVYFTDKAGHVWELARHTAPADGLPPM